MSHAETIAQSASKKARTALERLEFIEGKLIPSMADQVNRAIQNLQNQISELGEFVNALTESVGAEAVQEIVTTRRREATLKNVETKKAELAELTGKGTLVESEEVGAQSIVVGRVLDTDEKEVFPGWEAVAVAAQPEDIKSLLLGAKKGAAIKLPSGTTFELQNIYSAGPLPTPETTTTPPPSA